MRFERLSLAFAVLTILALLGGLAAPATARVDAISAAPYKVSLKTADPTVRVGSRVNLKGTVKPTAPGAKVVLQRKVGSKWRTLSTAKLTKSGSYSFAPKITSVGAWSLRVMKDKGARPAGTSSVLKVYGAGSAFVVAAAPSTVQAWDFEALTFAGSLSPASSGAPVALQRRAANGTWTTIATGKTSGVSNFALTAPAGAAVGTYRVHAGSSTKVAAADSPPIVVARRAVLHVSSGNVVTCVLGTGNAVACWGAAGSGQLGRGHLDRNFEPSPGLVVGLPPDVVELEVGGQLACVRTGGGAVWCWGAGASPDYDVLGGVDTAVPVPFPGLGSGVTQLAVGIAAPLNHDASSCFASSASGTW